MFRILFALISLFASANSVLAASPFPSGTFTGTGRFLGPENVAGSYTVESRQADGKLIVSYSYPAEGGQERRSVLTFVPQADGSFTITSSDGPQVGRGSCEGMLCSYAMAYPGGEVMELIRFAENSIEKVGRKKFGAMAISWSETLTRQP